RRQGTTEPAQSFQRLPLRQQRWAHAPVFNACRAAGPSHGGRKGAGIRREGPMSEVTGPLDAPPPAQPAHAAELLPLVYDDLRRLAARQLAHEAVGQTLEPTALVHEAYLRLARDKAGEHWDNRGHFFAACAEAMRRILVENARRKHALKHGG